MPTLPPLIALSLFASFRIQDGSSRVLRRVTQGVVVVMLSLYLVASSATLITYLSISRAPVQTARGTVWVQQMVAGIWNDILSYTASRMSEGDRIYAVPYFPLFYFLSDRDHPTRYVALGPGLPGRSAENEIIQQLEREHVDFVLYAPGQEYPGLEEFKNAYPRLSRYIQRHFDVDREFHSTFGLYAELLQRKSRGEVVGQLGVEGGLR